MKRNIFLAVCMAVLLVAVPAEFWGKEGNEPFPLVNENSLPDDSPQQLSGSDSQNQSTVNVNTSTTEFAFNIMLDGTLGFADSKVAGGGFGADIELGALSNNVLFTGIGIGVSGYWTNPPMSDYKVINMPIYAVARRYLFDSKTSPFAELALGGGVGFGKYKKSDVTTSGSFLLRTGVGLKIHYVAICVGYQLTARKKACGHSMYFTLVL